MSLLIGDPITLNLVYETTNLQITEAASSSQQKQGMHTPCCQCHSEVQRLTHRVE